MRVERMLIYAEKKLDIGCPYQKLNQQLTKFPAIVIANQKDSLKIEHSLMMSQNLIKICAFCRSWI